VGRAFSPRPAFKPAAPRQPAHRLHRQSQFRVDFVNADGSKGFHAPQEAGRLLAEAIDLARQAQLRRGQTERSPTPAR